MENTKAILLSTLVPKEILGEATLKAIYTINHILSLVISGISLNKHVFQFAPNYSELHVFRSTCFFYIASFFLIKVKYDKIQKDMKLFF